MQHQINKSINKEKKAAQDRHEISIPEEGRNFIRISIKDGFSDEAG